MAGRDTELETAEAAKEAEGAAKDMAMLGGAAAEGIAMEGIAMDLDWI